MVTQIKSDALASAKSAPDAASGGVASRPKVPYLNGQIVRGALIESFRNLDPRVQVRNPVMFVVFVGSIFTSVIGMGALFGELRNEGSPAFILSVAVWLWLTVLFANFAEAVAEGRGKAQAATLRSMR